ncbi:unnamed protein product [Amoebophrya sp. A25]|nr:unnamed protein product [Amoebophrya sp. A25]|eukprot:GSA25T00019973001.1
MTTAHSISASTPSAEVVADDVERSKSKRIKLFGEWIDVTDFHARHPGGSDVLLLYENQDATDVYEAFHVSNRARAILKRLPRVAGRQEAGQHLPVEGPLPVEQEAKLLQVLAPPTTVSATVSPNDTGNGDVPNSTPLRSLTGSEIASLTGIKKSNPAEDIEDQLSDVSTNSQVDARTLSDETEYEVDDELSPKAGAVGDVDVLDEVDEDIIENVSSSKNHLEDDAHSEDAVAGASASTKSTASSAAALRAARNAAVQEDWRALVQTWKAKGYYEARPWFVCTWLACVVLLATLVLRYWGDYWRLLDDIFVPLDELCSSSVLFLLPRMCVYMLHATFRVFPALIQGFFFGQFGWLMHCAGHAGVFRDHRYDYYLQVLCLSFFLADSSVSWKRKHDKHHAKTNVLDHDPDIQTLFFFENKIVDTHWPFGEKAKNLLLQYQHYYTYVLYSFFGHWRQAECWFTVFGASGYDNGVLVKKNTNKTGRSSATSTTTSTSGSGASKKTDDVEMERGILRLECAALIGHYILRLFIYATCLQDSMSFLGFCWQYHIALSVMGLYLSLVFTANHNQMPIQLDAKEETNWLEMNTNGTVNYQSDIVSSFMTGYLNFQIEHHLCPSMPCHLYPTIQPDVRELCKKHGIAYGQGTFWQALCDNHDALARVAKMRGDLHAELSTTSRSPEAEMDKKNA